MKKLFLLVTLLLSLAVFAQKLDTSTLATDDKEAWKRIESYRQRVLAGESMAALATLYTEDPGSAKTGGRYDNIARGMFVPEFEKVAFALKAGEVSEVFLTTYGFHFIQLVAAHDGLVDVRHILVTSKTNSR